MANKAYYGKVVRSVNYAMTLLGYQAMRQILVTSFLLDHFIKQLGLTAFSFERFQKQSHFCAAISGLLAESLDYKKTEDLFTVSMLYNIGKLIIVVYFNEEHQNKTGKSQLLRPNTRLWALPMPKSVPLRWSDLISLKIFAKRYDIIITRIEL
jgi:HD-like signal output (HDOD) protein